MELKTRRSLAGLNEETIQRYGKYIVAVTMSYYIFTSFRSIVPPDAKHAIDAHMPQGYDRSLIAARLEQRHTKALLMKYLPLSRLREDLRLETDRQEKLNLWSKTLRLTLAGILAASYIHSLTITLFALKNTVRVLIFLLRRREEEMLQSKGLVPGALSQLRAWWSNGTKVVVMEKFMQFMTRRLGQEMSPFGNSDLDEELGPASMPPLSAWELPPSSEVVGAEGGFSVRHILRVAVPRIIACASRVVDHAFEVRPSHLFNVTNIVTRSELRELFNDLTAEMNRRVNMVAWVKLSPTAGASARGLQANTYVEGLKEIGPGGGFDFAEPWREEDLVEFPAGSTAMVGANGKLIRPQAKVSYVSYGDVNVTEEARAPPQTMFDGLPQPVGDADNRHSALPTTPVEEERGGSRIDSLQRERQIKAQSTGFFQELLRSNSVSELVYDYASEVLHRTVREIMDSLQGVKSYDKATESLKVLMFIAALEGPRQRLYDAEFDIKTYLKLFCEESVRSTCSQ